MPSCTSRTTRTTLPSSHLPRRAHVAGTAPALHRRSRRLLTCTATRPAGDIDGPLRQAGGRRTAAGAVTEPALIAGRGPHPENPLGDCRGSSAGVRTGAREQRRSSSCRVARAATPVHQPVRRVVDTRGLTRRGGRGCCRKPGTVSGQADQGGAPGVPYSSGMPDALPMPRTSRLSARAWPSSVWPPSGSTSITASPAPIENAPDYARPSPRAAPGIPWWCPSSTGSPDRYPTPARSPTS